MTYRQELINEMIREYDRSELIDDEVTKDEDKLDLVKDIARIIKEEDKLDLVRDGTEIIKEDEVNDICESLLLLKDTTLMNVINNINFEDINGMYDKLKCGIEYYLSPCGEYMFIDDICTELDKDKLPRPLNPPQFEETKSELLVRSIFNMKVIIVRTKLMKQNKLLKEKE